MGVPYLTTFMDVNPQVLTDLRLHDTRVVMDGNNLFHMLYYFFKVNMQYGGDYDTYASYVRYYFKTFLSCGIRPYIVFDGGYDSDDKKLKTSMKRAQDRLDLAGVVSVGGKGRVLPILAFQTFLMVLNELGIPYVTCDFEADQEIASLATEWDCPVMSNDSDFYIFDIKKGLILLDYLNLKVHTSDASDGEYKYLDVQIYYVDNLLRLFQNMDRKLLPLFATLIGNDFVDSKCFTDFFNKASLPNPWRVACRISFPKRHVRLKKFVSLFMWLESTSDLNDAVEKVLSHFPESEHEKMSKIINKSIKSYTDLTCNVRSYFEDEDAQMHNQSSMITYDGNTLPQWFVKAIRTSELSPQVLNAILHHRVIILTQVEDFSEMSAYSCASVLRQLLYSILLTLDEDAAEGKERTQGGRGHRRFHFDEYDRKQKRQIKNEIQPVKELPSGEPVPRLRQIPDMPLEMRRKILLDTLEATDSGIAGVCGDLQLPLLVIRYWIKHAEPKVSKVHLMLILASFVKLGLVDVDISTAPKCDCKDPVSIHAFHSLCTAELLAESKKSLSKFCGVPFHKNATFFDCSIIHVFAQFQSCLHAALALNQILLSPLPCPDPARMLCGTFMYIFCWELRSRPDPLLYVHVILGRSTPVADCFQALYNKSICSIDEECFRPSGSGKTGGKKKRKKQDKASSVDAVCEPSDLAEKDPVKLQYSRDCAIVNRFDHLGLDDD